jgi:hypothetical protein
MVKCVIAVWVFVSDRVYAGAPLGNGAL